MQTKMQTENPNLPKILILKNLAKGDEFEKTLSQRIANCAGRCVSLLMFATACGSWWVFLVQLSFETFAYSILFELLFDTSNLYGWKNRCWEKHGITTSNMFQKRILWFSMTLVLMHACGRLDETWAQSIFCIVLLPFVSKTFNKTKGMTMLIHNRMYWSRKIKGPDNPTCYQLL